MARSKSKAARKRSKKGIEKIRNRLLLSIAFLLTFGAVGAAHYVRANTQTSQPAAVDVDPNFHVKTVVTQFLEDNNATELLPIIKCESHFRQFEEDGTVLKNREGSSAIGVAQILSSKHPDPKIIYRYNKRNNTDFSVDDFDITTLEGNIGYALVLYKIRGTKDWECSKRFRF